MAPLERFFFFFFLTPAVTDIIRKITFSVNLKIKSCHKKYFLRQLKGCRIVMQ